MSRWKMDRWMGEWMGVDIGMGLEAEDQSGGGLSPGEERW